MGGIRTDLHGRTSLRGLYAAGEAACTGVHGANRLASNSLLEGLVFGARAARAVLADNLPMPSIHDDKPAMPPLNEPEGAESTQTQSVSAQSDQVEDIIARLQRAMWAYAGLLRERSTMQQGLAEVHACAAALEPISSGPTLNRRTFEAKALCRVAEAILRSALARQESRGAHFRNDFPTRNDRDFQKHSIYRSEAPITFEPW
jgi:L-aspartate oxidase